MTFGARQSATGTTRSTGQQEATKFRSTSGTCGLVPRPPLTTPASFTKRPIDIWAEGGSQGVLCNGRGEVVSEIERELEVLLAAKKCTM